MRDAKKKHARDYAEPPVPLYYAHLAEPPVLLYYVATAGATVTKALSARAAVVLARGGVEGRCTRVTGGDVFVRRPVPRSRPLLFFSAGQGSVQCSKKGATRKMHEDGTHTAKYTTSTTLATHSNTSNTIATL